MSTALVEEIRAAGRANLAAAMDAAFVELTGGDTDEETMSRCATAIDQAALDAFPDVTVETLIATWRELARRKLREADELVRWHAARQRQKQP